MQVKRIKEREHRPITDKVLEAVYGKGFYVMEKKTKEPHEVFIRIDNEEKKILGYACPECSIFHSAAVYACRTPDAVAESLRAARECCHRPCKDCGKDMFEPGKTHGYYTACPDCRVKHDELRHNMMLEKANKIPLSEYSGRFYWQEEFYEDFGELLTAIQDSLDVDDLVAGRFGDIWGCKDIPFTMSAEDVIESALEEHYEDAGDNITPKDVQRLQRMLDKWCRDMKIVSYENDYRTLIVPPQNFWLDGLMCSHPGCTRQAVVYASNDKFCCSQLDHREEGLVYQAFLKSEP